MVGKNGGGFIGFCMLSGFCVSSARMMGQEVYKTPILGQDRYASVPRLVPSGRRMRRGD